MIKVFGVLNQAGGHTDVSNTLHGAKCYATRHGYLKVSERIGFNVFVRAIKKQRSWKNEN